ncbi:MAG: T9SS type A sorting domain-containing protein, partial [Cyclobacteriaceae bacterium]
SWNPASWTTVGTAGSDQRTPQLINIIQEIVNRSDWSSGNSMSFIITGSGKRTAESYEGNPGKAPLLYIKYSVPGSTSGRSAIEKPESKISTDTDQKVIDIFPNPVSDRVSLRYSPHWSGASLTIYTLDGRSVIESILFGEQNHSVTTSDLQAGIYIIIVKSDSAMITQKIVKE